MYYALFYEYVPDILERRLPFRADHLAHAQAYRARGEMLLAGAWSDPADGALLVFKAPGRETVDGFVANDPYVKNGLVTAHRVREWNVVIGAQE